MGLPDELASHASATVDLTRLCKLMADGRLDGQIELESSWREPSQARDALLERRRCSPRRAPGYCLRTPKTQCLLCVEGAEGLTGKASLCWE
jgi:hypothetical protein